MAAIRTETRKRKHPGSSGEQPGRGGFLARQSPRNKFIDDEISPVQQMTPGTGCPVETEGIETQTAEAADIPNMPANADTEEIGAPGTETMILSRKQTSETSNKKESTVDSLAFYLLACQGKPLSKRDIDRILQLVQAGDYSPDECRK